MHTPQQIVEFWFSDKVKPLWFKSTREFDQELETRYESLFKQALNGDLDAWCETPIGCLALVIVLDQFPLNIYRDRPESFVAEDKAQAIAHEACDQGFDQMLTDEQKAFLYMPLMHSEKPADQDRSLELFERAGLKNNLKWARHHRDIVRRFGRFPHRNAILGRESTREEIDYLESDDAFTG